MYAIFLTQLPDLHLVRRAAAAAVVAAAAVAAVVIADAAVEATVVDEGDVTDPDPVPLVAAAAEMCLPHTASMQMMIRPTARRSTLATSITGSVVLIVYVYLPNRFYLLVKIATLVMAIAICEVCAVAIIIKAPLRLAIVCGSASVDCTHVQKQTDDRYVREKFSKYGVVTDVFIPVDGERRPRGFCFVTFEEKRGADDAVAEMDGLVHAQGSE